VVVDRLGVAVDAFQTAAYGFEQRKTSILSTAYPAASTKLMAIEKILSGNFTALSWWDDTIYPHEQALWDLQWIDGALAALDRRKPQAAAALKALANVGYTFYGLMSSEPVHVHKLARHDPDYWAISWGGQGHLPQPIDVMPEYRQIEAGAYGAALSGLAAERERQIAQLNARLVRMAELLEPLPMMIATMR
jgi:hypothetical protein